jgi:SAM-dependent methyltransferase
MGEPTGQDKDANSAFHPREGEGVAEFDSFASNYEEALAKGLRFSGEQSEYFARGRVKALAAHLASRPSMAGARVILDFGCGTGSTTPLLKDLPSVARVIGTDVSPRLLDTARAEYAGGSIEFVTHDQIPERAADVAYCNGVFHHIPPNARDEAITQVRSALRPGGVFALCENNPWNPGSRLVMRSIPFDRDADPLSARQARRLLIGTGFDIEATEFLFFFPRTFNLLRRWESRLAHVPLGAQYIVFARRPSRA